MKDTFINTSINCELNFTSGFQQVAGDASRFNLDFSAKFYKKK